MKEIVTIARYLLLIAVWLLFATFVICVLYYAFSKQPGFVTGPFLKEYAILLVILFVVFYFVNLMNKRNQEETY